MQYYDCIIFDLDGTLWQTTDSYLYAYHKIIQAHPENKSALTDTDILATRGLLLEQVAEIVFPHASAQTKSERMKECLYYSCDYLLNHSSTIYQDVEETLLQLAKTHRLFLVSSCPKEYIDVFLQKLDTRIVFQDIKFRNDSKTKIERLHDIIHENHFMHVLMVGDSPDDMPLRNSNVDFAYASYGYRICDTYDYYLNSIGDLIAIVDFLNYRMRILQSADDYQTLKQGDAQVTLMKNGENYLFGFWRFSKHIEHNTKLFQTLHFVANILGAKKLIGPIDYTTWYQYRLAIDQYDWHLLPDIYNSPEQVAFLKSQGYYEKYTYSSTLATIDESIWNLAKHFQLSNEFSIKIVQGLEAFHYIESLYDVAMDSFQDGILYSPIQLNDFQDLYIKNFQFVDPDLVILYHLDEIVAFSFCYADIKQHIYVSKTAAIKKRFQNQKIILTLIDESFKIMKAKGYHEVLYHFQNEQKSILNRLWKKTIIKQKRYALFARDIVDEKDV